MKIEPVTYIRILMNFELPEDQKVKLWTFQAQPASGLFHPHFLCKSCFRVISVIKMVIWDQSKAILLIFEKI